MILNRNVPISITAKNSACCGIKVLAINCQIGLPTALFMAEVHDLSRARE